MPRRKPGSLPKAPRPPVPPSPKDVAAAALNADPGPLIVTLAVNRVTGVVGMAGNAASEHDLELVRDALTMAQAGVHQQLVAAAEARGAAKAAAPPASKSP